MPRHSLSLRPTACFSVHTRIRALLYKTCVRLLLLQNTRRSSRFCYDEDSGNAESCTSSTADSSSSPLAQFRIPSRAGLPEDFTGTDQTAFRKVCRSDEQLNPAIEIPLDCSPDLLQDLHLFAALAASKLLYFSNGPCPKAPFVFARLLLFKLRIMRLFPLRFKLRNKSRSLPMLLSF